MVILFAILKASYIWFSFWIIISLQDLPVPFIKFLSKLSNKLIGTYSFTALFEFLDIGFEILPFCNFLTYNVTYSFIFCISKSHIDSFCWVIHASVRKICISFTNFLWSLLTKWSMCFLMDPIHMCINDSFFINSVFLIVMPMATQNSRIISSYSWLQNHDIHGGIQACCCDNEFFFLRLLVTLIKLSWKLYFLLSWETHCGT